MLISPTRILVLGLLLAACKATPLPESTTDLDTRSTVATARDFDLGPGDLLYVAVFGKPEYSPPPTGVRIAPDGTLSLPLLGSVPVTGKSPEELRRVVEAGLDSYLNEPSVTVAVMEYVSRRYYLFGEVAQPGPKVMDRPVTALEALATGGGFEPGANRDEVVVIRRHGADIEVIPFDGQTPGPDGLVQIRPDDFIFVGQDGVGVFSDQVQPYLQGVGYSLSQIASVAIAYDTLQDD